MNGKERSLKLMHLTCSRCVHKRYLNLGKRKEKTSGENRIQRLVQLPFLALVDLVSGSHYALNCDQTLFFRRDMGEGLNGRGAHDGCRLKFH